ncbi:MAG: hypothetical protein LAO76_01360 [Acidobacteriia bacterium]|nr:hypothetical protein [Terriglobia bacterium]
MLAGRRRTPVLEYLDKITQSKCFRQSEFLKRLLRFLVVKVVRSQEHQIKEYSLGTEVFQRKESFDPRSDTIVRVQVHRLRVKLEKYYKTEGAHDPIRFEIPKGSYVPVIVHREPIDLPCKAASSRSSGARCRIAVLPFSDLSEDGSIGKLADAITEILIDDLTMVGGLDVISRTSANTFKQQYKDARAIGKHLRVDAILEGSVLYSVEVVRIRARLVNARTGFTLWTAAFDSKDKNLLMIQKQISEGIVPNIQSLLLPPRPAKQKLRAVQQSK